MVIGMCDWLDAVEYIDVVNIIIRKFKNALKKIHVRHTQGKKYIE